MTKIPLILRLKKQIHRNVAEAQDLIVRALYDVFPDAVLHGGTAIWRCYNGNRFSEDIDAYILKEQDKLKEFFENLKKIGFAVHKKKVSERSIFSTLELNRTIVRFEALFKDASKKSSLREYETADGNLITVNTLSPESLIKEKVDAYLNRLKVRDFYDIFFLIRYAKTEEISSSLKKLAENFKKPVDEKELRVLLTEGITPDTEKMLEYIKNKVH